MFTTVTVCCTLGKLNLHKISLPWKELDVASNVPVRPSVYMLQASAVSVSETLTLLRNLTCHKGTLSQRMPCVDIYVYMFFFIKKDVRGRDKYVPFKRKPQII